MVYSACSNNITFENIDDEQSNKYSTILVKGMYLLGIAWELNYTKIKNQLKY